MKTIKINLNKITQAEIDLLVGYLKRGRVLAYPTDTVYGLGCDARNAKAIKKVNKIKGESASRRSRKSFLVLISDFKMLKKYCFVNKEQMKYLREIWPGPVTVILKKRPGLLPAELTGSLNSLAVRLPESEFLVKIISEAGFPIVSTSLNKIGGRLLISVKNLEKQFKYLPDLAINVGTIEGCPSKLMDIRDMEKIKVIRR